MRAYTLAFNSAHQWCVIDATKANAFVEEVADSLGLVTCARPFSPAVVLIESAHPCEESLPRAILTELNLPYSGWHCCFCQHAQWWVCAAPSESVVGMLMPVRPGGRTSQELKEIIHGIFFNVYRRLLYAGGIVLHAALLAHEGSASVIVAPSGTGKTTCCRRVPSPWQGLCDEEAVLIPSSSGKWHAHPMLNITDFTSRGIRAHHAIQRGFLLEGLYFLQQGASDSIDALGEAEAAGKMFRAASEVYIRYRSWHCYDRPEYRLRQFENTANLARSLPCYTLSATLTGNFWDKMKPKVTHGD
jgi:SynChlorMet cassette protein ScmC